jgi:hypothetical protein
VQVTTLAGDLEDLRGVREPEMVHRDGLEGAQLDPAVGLVARAIQDGNTVPGKLGAALEQGGLVGLDGQQVVRPLGDHEELGGVAVGLQRIGRDHRIGQVQVGQQWLEAGDLARCAVDLALGNHRTGGVVHRGEQVDLPAVAAGAAQGLAVHRDRTSTPVGPGATVGQPGADGGGHGASRVMNGGQVAKQVRGFGWLQLWVGVGELGEGQWDRG